MNVQCKYCGFSVMCEFRKPCAVCTFRPLGSWWVVVWERFYFFPQKHIANRVLELSFLRVTYLISVWLVIIVRHYLGLCLSQIKSSNNQELSWTNTGAVLQSTSVSVLHKADMTPPCNNCIHNHLCWVISVEREADIIPCNIHLPF